MIVDCALDLLLTKIFLNKFSLVFFVLKVKEMLSGVSIVTAVCVTGSMRTTPSLSMRAGTQTVRSSGT